MEIQAYEEENLGAGPREEKMIDIPQLRFIMHIMTPSTMAFFV